MKPMFTFRRTVLGAVLLGSALALSATPHSPGIAVTYHDVDLSSPQGAAVLYSRISQAAKRVCNETSSKNLRETQLYEVCYRGAVANAVSNVNANTLTALHRVKTQKATVS